MGTTIILGYIGVIWGCIGMVQGLYGKIEVALGLKRGYGFRV